ncbi:MAG: hypothetical protein M3R38_17735 [Actinomycetota bacterium]|nr:hypothetical protein [Actinomycetota bacterium]
MSKHDTEGYRRFKAKRAETAPTTTDRDHQDFVSAMSGEDAERRAGVARHLEPGGPDAAAGVGDDRAYEAYVDEITGAAARRRSEENACQKLRDRESEIVRHASQVGGGLSRSHEHLRRRLQGFGRPGEGS